MVQMQPMSTPLSAQIRRTTNCSDACNIVLDARADGIIFSIYLVRPAWPIGDANV